MKSVRSCGLGSLRPAAEGLRGTDTTSETTRSKPCLPVAAPAGRRARSRARCSCSEAALGTEQGIKRFVVFGYRRCSGQRGVGIDTVLATGPVEAVAPSQTSWGGSRARCTVPPGWERGWRGRTAQGAAMRGRGAALYGATEGASVWCQVCRPPVLETGTEQREQL